MFSGVLSGENLSQTLRDISQRRRQGVLEVSVLDQQYELFFVQGRVVDVHKAGQNLCEEIVQCLKRIGTLPENWEDYDATLAYRDLYLFINSKGYLADEEFFKVVLKHRLLDQLYAVCTANSGFFSFKVKMVEYDKELCPSISVGQLLLDLVAFETDLPKFKDMFQDDLRVVAEAGNPGSLSEEEKLIVDLLHEALKVSDLRARSILSAYHFQETLLSLRDQKIIRLSDEQSVAAELGFDLDGLSSSLDSVIDESFGVGNEAAAERETKHEPMVESGMALSAVGAAKSADIKVVSARKQSAWAAGFVRYQNSLLKSNWVPYGIILVFFVCALIGPLM